MLDPVWKRANNKSSAGNAESTASASVQVRSGMAKQAARHSEMSDVSVCAASVRRDPASPLAPGKYEEGRRRSIN